MIIGKRQIEELRKHQHANREHISIAIDGPAGTGKTSIAKALAEKYGYLFFSAGSLYRSLAYACVAKNIDINSQQTVEVMLHYLPLEYRVVSDNTGKHLAIYLDGEEITDKLHSKTISNITPICAKYPLVRQHFLQIQRDIANSTDIVMEGRDIGSVVLPNATFKFYLTASPEARASRRFQELSQDSDITYQDILADIIIRDTQDKSRKLSPLQCTADATLIDTTDMTIKESFDSVCLVIESSLPQNQDIEMSVMK